MLIGISGTNGSGKDSLGQMLAQRHGYMFVSVTEILRDEARKRGLPIERPNLWTISAQWRRESGLGVLIDKALQQFETQKHHYKGLAIASLRNPGEVDRVHELGGTVIWLDADSQVRYQRTESRARGSEDHKTFEQFLAIQEAEMNQGGDDATLSLAGVKAKADIFIENSGKDVKAFQDQAEKALSLA
jgi:cytidylate kinase